MNYGIYTLRILYYVTFSYPKESVPQLKWNPLFYDFDHRYYIPFLSQFQDILIDRWKFKISFSTYVKKKMVVLLKEFLEIWFKILSSTKKFDKTPKVLIFKILSVLTFLHSSFRRPICLPWTPIFLIRHPQKPRLGRGMARE